MELTEEIKQKAEYCFNCKNKPCKKACPIETDIPFFIEKIKEGNIEEAYKILMDNNIFSQICSNVCPQEKQCEGSCTRRIKSTSVEIGELEKLVNKYANQKGIVYNIEKNKTIDKKVAVVGSGPASLSCAYELAKAGVQVKIFEKEEKLGGILRYGIPSYRLNKNDLDELINKILNLGINVQPNCEFGTDINIKSLKEQGYDAIFIGIGASQPTTYSLCDEELKGIYTSDCFLKEFNQGNKIDNLGRTVVIGGGNVAMDSARTAIRMGATNVTVLYRRGIENMPARKIEIQKAIEEGINIIPYTKVISAKGQAGNLSEIECIKTEVIDGKAIDLENTNYNMEVDTVIFAIGLLPEKQILEKEGILLENGLIAIDENGKTNLDNVYAGGDVAEKKSTVCKAIANGKMAAKSILKDII